MKPLLICCVLLAGCGKKNAESPSDFERFTHADTEVTKHAVVYGYESEVVQSTGFYGDIQCSIKYTLDSGRTWQWMSMYDPGTASIGKIVWNRHGWENDVLKAAIEFAQKMNPEFIKKWNESEQAKVPTSQRKFH